MHLHPVSAPSWEMEFINQGQITLYLKEEKKKHGREGEREGKGNGNEVVRKRRVRRMGL